MDDGLAYILAVNMILCALLAILLRKNAERRLQEIGPDEELGYISALGECARIELAGFLAVICAVAAAGLIAYALIF